MKSKEQVDENQFSDDWGDNQWIVVGTDEYNGFEIWNNGGTTFEVTEDGAVIDRFSVNPETLERVGPQMVAKGWVTQNKNKHNVTESKLNEGSYRGDLQRLVTPELHIDQHRSKMGEDDDIIVVSFKVQGKEPANDLVSFLETGYDFILDADASPGEISPGQFLVFFELSRRTTAVDRIWQIVEEVLNLTLQDMDDWVFAYGTPEQRGSRRKVETYPFTKENLEKMIPMSPRQYRDANEEFEAEEPAKEPKIDFVEPSPDVPAQDTDDIAAMKNIAGIPVNQQAPDDDEMNSLRQQAGLI